MSHVELGSGANAEFGNVSRRAVVVAHELPAPLSETVHPAGKAGAVKLSKSAENTTLEPPWRPQSTTLLAKAATVLL